ncbi:MAG: 4Fe-4S dicluster domain-containing protein [Promethearchaeota archaeon]|nr:MAG: 4Fe-4S dicluster domain-containing protein [Candidatus Lokiarchaeota archaeon]
MSNEEEVVYKELQEHLNKMPIGIPSVKSGSGLRLLKTLFTPQEAKIAKFLRFGWERDLESLDKIYQRAKETGISLEELETILDQMMKKGLVMFKRENDKKFYGNALLMVGMFEFQVNELNEDFIKEFDKYFMEGWLPEALKLKASQLRTIPVEESIEPEMNVSIYDDLESLLETTDGPYSVANCVCRQMKDMLGEPCKATDRREVCLQFGYAAKLYIEQGKGREITKNEVLEILRKSQEEGLVLEPDNSQHLSFICCCCGCCCENLTKMKLFPRPGDYTVTNHYANIDDELCIGCGSCVEICPMDAIKLKNDKAQIKKRRCIGCGNCVAKCPSDAIILKKKDRQFTPFPTMDELFDKILERKTKLMAKNLKS